MKFLSIGVWIFIHLVIMPAPSHAAEAGKTLYASRCQGCHGPDGKGNQAMAKALQADIPDLTPKEMAKKPDPEIIEVLTKGKGKMPAATGLSEKELKDLMVYIRGLAKGK